MSPQMACLRSAIGRICEEVGGCTQACRRLSDHMCKEVGGYLKTWALMAPSITLNDDS